MVAEARQARSTVVLDGEVAVEAEAARDADAEGETVEVHWKEVVEVGSWLPAEAGHDEELTWAGLLDCGYVKRQGQTCRLAPGSSREGKAERWKAESADHGRTCSRMMVVAA